MQDDAQELDIEVVTPGTSIVNDTINYTTQPSVNADWSRIPNATLSLPLQNTISEFRTHRFDCDSKKGVSYFLDEKLVHTDNHNLPREGGSLQLKLWADGNKWWSGMPSKTDVRMHVKSIVAYFNTTSSLNNDKWNDRCARAGSQKPCKAVTETGHTAKNPVDHCMQNPRDCPTYPKATISSDVTILPLYPAASVTTLSPRLTTSTSKCLPQVPVSECHIQFSTYSTTPVVTLRPTSGAKKVRPVPCLPPTGPYTGSEGDHSYKRSGCMVVVAMVLMVMILL